MIKAEEIVQKQLDFYNANDIVKAVAIYEIEDCLIKKVWFVYE